MQSDFLLTLMKITTFIIKAERCCMQNNQFPTKILVDLKGDSNITKAYSACIGNLG